jgi:hypothetical protein
MFTRARRKMSESTTKTEPITAEQFREKLQGMWAAMNEIAFRNSWCEEYEQTMQRVSPYFPDDRREDVTVPEGVPADGGYEGELKRVRGRFLYYAKRGTISLDQANAILAAGGLPGLSQTSDWRIAVNFSVADRDHAKAVHEKVQQFLHTVPEAKSHETSLHDRYSTSTNIPESEVIEPVRSRSRW